MYLPTGRLKVAVVVDYAYVLRVAANKFSDRPAVVFGDQAWTFAELDAAVDRTAAALDELGLGGQTVASVLLNEPETVALYLALARIGAVSVPVNARLVHEEMAFVLEDSGAVALVVDREYVQAGRELRGRVDGVERLLVANGEADDAIGLPEMVSAQAPTELWPEVDGTSAATITYTSGTTGFPKGVVRTHDANLWNVANSALGSPRTPHDVEFFTLPIFGIGFLHFAMPAWLCGACVLLDRAFDAARTWRLIEQHRPNRIFLAPTMVDSMLAVPGGARVDVSCLDTIYCAYEFHEALRDRALQRFGDIFVYMYGLTEAQLTAAGPGEFARKPTSAGKPMGLMRVRILDPSGDAVPQGTVGEIALEGPALMAGYHNRLDATAEALADGWVRTGDLGFLDADGDLHFSGRSKEIIKTGGYTVDPAEVERVLFALPEVREAAVVGVPDEHWGEMVVAFVVAHPEAQVDEERVRAHCRRHLGDFKIPKAVRTLAELPKNPTGKVERGRLRSVWNPTDPEPERAR